MKLTEERRTALRLAAIVTIAAMCVFGLTIGLVDISADMKNGHLLIQLVIIAAETLLAGGVFFMFLTRILQKQSLISEKLLESEDRFRQAVGHFPYGVTIYDTDLQIRYLNNFARRLYDKECDQIIGLADAHLLPSTDGDRITDALNKVKTTLKPLSVELDFERHSANLAQLFSFVPSFNAEGKLREIISVQVDMTAFKTMGQHVRASDRSLNTLLSVNRALAGAETESRLLGGFCRALVEHGGFRSAVVGFLAHGDRFFPRYAAWGWMPKINERDYGDEKWSPEELGCCQALTTGEAVFNGADCGRGDYQSWEAEQADHRETEQVCLPIRVFGTVYCALRLVYSSRLSVANDAGGTLDRLAEGIGFALEAVHNRKALAAERFNLRERMKELQCVFDIQNRLFGESTSAASDWQYIADRIPTAFLRPPATWARIVIGNEPFVSEEFRETGQTLAQPIGPPDEPRGQIEVFTKCEDELPFVPEESELLQAIGRLISEAMNRDAAATRNSQLQKLFTTTFEKTAAGIAHVSTSGEFIRVNRRFAEIAGWPADELLGKNFTEITHPDDREEDMSQVAALLADKISHYNLAKRYLTKTGAEVWINLSVSLVRDGGGNSDYFIAVIESLDDILRLEVAIRESEDRFRTLFNAIPDGTAICDLDGHFLEANPAAASMLGYQLEELLKRTIFDVDPSAAKDREATRRMWRELTNSHETAVVNTTHQRNDGSAYPAEVRVKSFDYQGSPAIVGIFRDISARLRTEEQMRLQTSALEAAANTIVITDREANIVWANPSFTRTSGYSLEEAIGQNPRILQSGRQDAGFYRALWETLGRGETWKGSFINRRKDGTEYHEDAIITPVPDAQGEITHYVAIKEDVTDQHSLEEQFRRAQRMESIGLLAGGIAHDLNNVLAPILMAIEMLRLDAPKEDVDEILQSLEDSVQRGAGIIRQVLTFARGSEGEKSLLQVRHLLKEIVKVAKETFPRNITINGNFPSSLWPVSGDPSQIHQILLNLAVNARDAMPEGGTLAFAAVNETLEEPRTFLNLECPAGPYIRITVRDSGAGMPEEVVEKIFDPFFTTKEQGKGTGLGLPTVLGIVKSHRGLIDVNSRKGEGTTFSVWLPAQPGKTAEGASAATTPLPQGRGQTILVVDDEAEIARLTAKILLGNGYRVETAADGTKAIALVAANRDRFSAVITDIMMPFMDGVALTRSLRQLHPELPIIVVSGMMDTDIAKDRSSELKELGVKTILAKPFKMRELLESLSEQLNG